MIKRPLNERFATSILEGRKVTTIRNKPWPVGKPIMLYCWTGAAYRSKQRDVVAVTVESFVSTHIRHREDGTMAYEHTKMDGRPLHETEGFCSRSEMDDWFIPLVKKGQTVVKTLIRFQLVNAKGQP